MTQEDLPEGLSGPLGAFAEDIHSRMPGLLSVTVYGSAARGDYVPGVSDINILVIAKALPPDVLRAGAMAERQWREKLPLSLIFATPDYLHSSADVFPLEFLDMRESHVNLLGKDPLAELNIDPAMLRHEVEAELRGKLMRLRGAYVRVCESPAAIADLLRDSLASFRIVFQGLLRLHGEAPPVKREEVMRSISAEFELDSDALAQVVSLHKGDNVSDVTGLFGRYLACVERLVEVVDNWKHS